MVTIMPSQAGNPFLILFAWWRLANCSPILHYGEAIIWKYLHKSITSKCMASFKHGYCRCSSWTCTYQPRWWSTLDVIDSWAIGNIYFDASPWKDTFPIYEHKTHKERISSQSTIDNYLPYHKITWSHNLVHSICFVSWSIWIQSFYFVLINLTYLFSLSYDDVLKVDMISHTIFICTRHALVITWSSSYSITISLDTQWIIHSV